VRQTGAGRGLLILAVAAIATFGAAALIGGWLIAQNNDGTPQVPAAPAPSTRAAAEPTSESSATTTPSAPSPTTAPSVPSPAVLPPPTGTDAQGFVGYGYAGARCDAESRPVVMGRTTQSVFVVCESDPTFAFYRGVRLSDGAAIELLNAVRSSGGFDVTNPADGTRYQVRPDSLTITTPGGQVFTEPMVQYAVVR
jgi:hypothetical protein